jgi:hypothetical protein
MTRTRQFYTSICNYNPLNVDKKSVRYKTAPSVSTTNMQYF